MASNSFSTFADWHLMLEYSPPLSSTSKSMLDPLRMNLMLIDPFCPYGPDPLNGILDERLGKHWGYGMVLSINIGIYCYGKLKFITKP